MSDQFRLVLTGAGVVTLAGAVGLTATSTGTGAAGAGVGTGASAAGRTTVLATSLAGTGTAVAVAGTTSRTAGTPTACAGAVSCIPCNRLNSYRHSLQNNLRNSWYSRLNSWYKDRQRSLSLRTPSKSPSHTIGSESGARPACPVPVCCIALSKNSSSPRSAP